MRFLFFAIIKLKYTDEDRNAGASRQHCWHPRRFASWGCHWGVPSWEYHWSGFEKENWPYPSIFTDFLRKMLQNDPPDHPYWPPRFAQFLPLSVPPPLVVGAGSKSTFVSQIANFHIFGRRFRIRGPFLMNLNIWLPPGGVLCGEGKYWDSSKMDLKFGISAQK